MFSNFRRGMSEKTTEMKEAFNRGTDRLFHVITSNDRILQFRYVVVTSLTWSKREAKQMLDLMVELESMASSS